MENLIPDMSDQIRLIRTCDAANLNSKCARIQLDFMKEPLREWLYILVFNFTKLYQHLV